MASIKGSIWSRLGCGAQLTLLDKLVNLHRYRLQNVPKCTAREGLESLPVVFPVRLDWECAEIPFVCGRAQNGAHSILLGDPVALQIQPPPCSARRRQLPREITRCLLRVFPIVSVDLAAVSPLVRDDFPNAAVHCIILHHRVEVETVELAQRRCRGGGTLTAQRKKVCVR